MIMLLGLTVLASSSEAIVVLCGEDKVEVNAPGIEKYSLTVHDALDGESENFEGFFPQKVIIVRFSLQCLAPMVVG